MRTCLRRCLALALLALLLCAPAARAGSDRKTGNIVNNGDIVQFQALSATMGAIQVSGTFTGTISFECSIDGTNWTALSVTPVGGGAAVTSATAVGTWSFSGALAVVRTRASASMTGTA